MIQYDAIEYSCFNNSRISVLLHHCIEELLISSTCSPIRIGYLAWTGGLGLRCGHGSKHREGHHRHHKLTQLPPPFQFSCCTIRLGRSATVDFSATPACLQNQVGEFSLSD